MISENQLLFDIAEEFEDIQPATWENYLKRCIRDGIREIGLTENHFLQSELVQADENKAFPIGDHVMELRGILIVSANGAAEEPVFARSKNMIGSSDDFINIPHRTSDAVNRRVVRWDPAGRCIFVENTSASGSDIDHAIIAYLGMVKDCDGNLLIPDEASTAIKARMAWKVQQRRRNRNREAVTATDVQAAFQYWHSMAGHARGRVRAVMLPRMNEIVREMWYRQRFNLPNAYEGGRS